MKFKKDGNIQKGFIDCNDTLYPYKIQYVGEHEKDGSLFKIDFLGVSQKYPESDLELFFDEISSDIVEDYLEEQSKEKQSLTVRFYKSDLAFLKEYAKKNGMKYQTLIRDNTHNLVKNLK